jgi:hypothetical protein
MCLAINIDMHQCTVIIRAKLGIRVSSKMGILATWRDYSGRVARTTNTRRCVLAALVEDDRLVSVKQDAVLNVPADCA